LAGAQPDSIHRELRVAARRLIHDSPKWSPVNSPLKECPGTPENSPSTLVVGPPPQSRTKSRQGRQNSRAPTSRPFACPAPFRRSGMVVPLTASPTPPGGATTFRPVHSTSSP
jgi:hypothetical protein